MAFGFDSSETKTTLFLSCAARGPHQHLRGDRGSARDGGALHETAAIECHVILLVWGLGQPARAP